MRGIKIGVVSRERHLCTAIVVLERLDKCLGDSVTDQPAHRHRHRFRKKQNIRYTQCSENTSIDVLHKRNNHILKCVIGLSPNEAFEPARLCYAEQDVFLDRMQMMRLNPLAPFSRPASSTNAATLLTLCWMSPVLSARNVSSDGYCKKAARTRSGLLASVDDAGDDIHTFRVPHLENLLYTQL